MIGVAGSEVIAEDLLVIGADLLQQIDAVGGVDQGVGAESDGAIGGRIGGDGLSDSETAVADIMNEVRAAVGQDARFQ